MVISGIIAIIGLSMVLPSAYQLNPAIQFYFGRHRELYFASELRWMILIRNNIGAFIVGLTILTALFIRAYSVWIILFLAGVLLAVAISAFPRMFIPVKPSWLREFEADHHPQDIGLIKARGRWLLEKYPEHFSRMIMTQEGWDAWVLTVI